MPTNQPTRRRRYTIDSALHGLSRKQDVKIEHSPILRLVIQSKESKKHNDLGNGSWGKIDFLRTRMRVTYGEF
jgi:hypothetical protein